MDFVRQQEKIHKIMLWKVHVTSVCVLLREKGGGRVFQNLPLAFFSFDNDLEKSGQENIWSSTFLTSQEMLVPGKNRWHSGLF